MKPMLVTDEISQPEMSMLKEAAFENMACILVTDDTSQWPISVLKEVEFKNMAISGVKNEIPCDRLKHHFNEFEKKRRV